MRIMRHFVSGGKRWRGLGVSIPLSALCWGGPERSDAITRQTHDHNDHNCPSSYLTGRVSWPYQIAGPERDNPRDRALAGLWDHLTEVQHHLRGVTCESVGWVWPRCGVVPATAVEEQVDPSGVTMTKSQAVVLPRRIGQVVDQRLITLVRKVVQMEPKLRG